MAPVEVVRAIGEDQRDRRVAQVADQEAEEVAGRAVGPVEILDDDDHRRDPGQPVQDAEQQFEQAALGGPGVEAGLGAVRRGTEVGDEPRELGTAVADDRVELVG